MQWNQPLSDTEIRELDEACFRFPRAALETGAATSDDLPQAVPVVVRQALRRSPRPEAGHP